MSNGRAARHMRDSRLVARVPFPGYPEGIAARQGRIYVSGPAAFGVPENAAPSRVFVYDAVTGLLLREILIENQSHHPRAISCIALGARDDLYVLDEQLGVVRIEISSGRQGVYGGPFGRVYESAFARPLASLVNDLAFDRAGHLYVTDSFQATIWRVAPGGGPPTVWFQSPLIDGPFGPNGIRVDAGSEYVYFAVSIDASNRGTIYRLPLVEQPAASDLAVFHDYAPGLAPDGVAFGRSGRLYVALFGQAISVLSSDGREECRLSGPARETGTPEGSVTLGESRQHRLR
jgi:sugar lactone lactonase YvrE